MRRLMDTLRLRLRLIDGRDLTSADATGPLRVALINETAVRRYWAGSSVCRAGLLRRPASPGPPEQDPAYDALE